MWQVDGYGAARIFLIVGVVFAHVFVALGFDVYLARAQDVAQEWAISIGEVEAHAVVQACADVGLARDAAHAVFFAAAVQAHGQAAVPKSVNDPGVAQESLHDQLLSAFGRVRPEFLVPQPQLAQGGVSDPDFRNVAAGLALWDDSHSLVTM